MISMIIVGLTGNFGMGKSTVAEIFRDLGAVTIDTDYIVRDLLEDSSILSEIKKTFGDDVIINGSANKQLLAHMVFEHPHLRISLENILHPAVFSKIEARISAFSGDNAPEIVIIEAPVIFERGYQNKFDRIITVFTPNEIAIERLKTKGVEKDMALKRLRSQFPIEMKAAKSDFAIDNSKDLENTRAQVEEICRTLKRQSGISACE